MNENGIEVDQFILLTNSIEHNTNWWSKLPVILFDEIYWIAWYFDVVPNIYFRWKRFNTDDDGDTESTPCFIGVMANCLWLLKETKATVLFKVLGELPYPSGNEFSIVRMKVPEPIEIKNKRDDGLLYADEYYQSLLRSYFRLDVDLDKHYEQWSAAHRHFREESERFYAIRMLDQEPVENLFSFICSQNNHISRISSLVEKLCSMYGPKICDFDGVTYYAFPDAEKLSEPKVRVSK